MHDVDAELVGTHLSENLSPNWTYNDRIHTELKPGTMDLLDTIEHQACTLESWKVNPSFFSTYPQYTNYL